MLACFCYIEEMIPMQWRQPFQDSLVQSSKTHRIVQIERELRFKVKLLSNFWLWGTPWTDSVRVQLDNDIILEWHLLSQTVQHHQFSETGSSWSVSQTSLRKYTNRVSNKSDQETRTSKSPKTRHVTSSSPVVIKVFFFVECFWNVLRYYTSLSRSREHLNFTGLTSATDYAFLTSALVSVRPFFASPLAVNFFHQKLRITRKTLLQQKLWDCQVVA